MMSNRCVLRFAFLLAIVGITGNVTAAIVTGHYYDVTMDRDLATIQVRAELAGGHHVPSLDNPS